ncbi:uncharacterized protein LOC126897294 [Daktulosphaira vitifoliae]|uniref:uncharacterized protein LOC126897294 n=1 Tax=Daktulosphaira vitifoliae TaxID=58002 RepID=UPI0021AAFD66|nr:uncharacterized protein LOC126897294 [Daktulosphaira vitifoliae]
MNSSLEKRPTNFGSVTDDQVTKDIMHYNPPNCLPNGCIKPEQHFMYDRQLAKVLMHYYTPEERKKVTLWINTLENMIIDEDELSERYMYLTCLNMLLQNGLLIPPFTRVPPKKPLKPLRDVIDKRLYKKVQTECRKRRVYEIKKFERSDRTTHVPHDFFNQQPVPQNGILCYGAAFSTIE